MPIQHDWRGALRLVTNQVFFNFPYFFENQSKVQLKGKALKITVSVGVCIVEPELELDVDLLLDAAHESHERAVQLGRSQIYELSMQEYQQRVAKEAITRLSIYRWLANAVGIRSPNRGCGAA